MTLLGLPLKYVLTGCFHRMVLNAQKKVIVFFSSCNSVKYHAELLNYIDIPVLDLHVSLLVHWPIRTELELTLKKTGPTKAAKENEYVL